MDDCIGQLLCCCCSGECWKSLCSSDCIGKCFECLGEGLTFLCKNDCQICSSSGCCGDLCGDSCKYCICSPVGWGKFFESSCCLKLESSCLSSFNCSYSIGVFSSCCQDYLKFQTGRFNCLLSCLPSWFLLNLGYSSSNDLGEQEEESQKRHHKKKQFIESSTKNEEKNPEIIYLPKDEEEKQDEKSKKRHHKKKKKQMIESSPRNEQNNPDIIYLPNNEGMIE